MENKHQLKRLFKEIYSKPEDLDHRIMQAVWAEAEVTLKEEETVEESGGMASWSWIIGLSAFGAAGIVYVFTLIDFSENPLIWVIFLAVLIPVVLDKLLVYRSEPRLK